MFKTLGGRNDQFTLVFVYAITSPSCMGRGVCMCAHAKVEGRGRGKGGGEGEREREKAVSIVRKCMDFLNDAVTRQIQP